MSYQPPSQPPSTEKPTGASVYWEPAIPDVGIYSTKFDILDTTHPIASIDKLYKVDFATGVHFSDVAVDSFTSYDGDLVTLFLHANRGCNVQFKRGCSRLCKWKVLQVQTSDNLEMALWWTWFISVTQQSRGLTTVTYLNSNLVIADTANGKYYTQKPKITNGIIQPLADWTLTEVVMNIFIRAYVERIKKGDMTIEQVPEALREEVEMLLHKDKLYHFGICFIVSIFQPWLAVGLALGGVWW